MKKQLFTVCLALTALFLITCEKTEPVTKITTDNVTVTGATSASIEGELGEQAQFGNIQYGICYDTTPNPTITDSKIELNNPKTTFTTEISNLEQNTKYYVRSFCCNGDEVTYGNQLTFTTLKSNPVLTTTPVTYTTGSDPISGGNITSDGGAPITARGICWATTTNPTTANRITTDGSGTGTYTSTLTRIVNGITYYVRAYATNSNGTFYGNEQTFNTNNPLLTTATTTNIMATTATSGGTVTTEGGSPVTARGVCWATTTNPTTANSKTTDGSGVGTFTSNLTGLTTSTTYYVRAYATNGAGTAYGNEQTFTTIGLPILTTTTTTNIMATTATSGGTITTDGGSAVIARGVCWATTANPTTANSKTTDGTGIGTFTSNLTGLTISTTYYVRAYATNSAGTVYGNQQTFTTTNGIPTLTTAATTSIFTTTATSGGTITTDGGLAITARGICWATTTNPTTANSKTTDGSGIGTFTSNLTGLNASTTYYVRVYATNSMGTFYGNEQTFTTNGPGEPLTDIDGNTYNTVWIGGQLWMAENLKTTKYTDGMPIPLVTDNVQWAGLTTGAYCWYNNDVANKAIYGALYNYYAVQTGSIAPIGWHVPSEAEWTQLENYLGGSSIAGGALKETGTTHWLSPNAGATNITGFTALPGGLRRSYGPFDSIGRNGFWWSSTEFNAAGTWYRVMTYADSYVGSTSKPKEFGFSVRCVRD